MLSVIPMTSSPISYNLSITFIICIIHRSLDQSGDRRRPQDYRADREGPPHLGLRKDEDRKPPEPRPPDQPGVNKKLPRRVGADSFAAVSIDSFLCAHTAVYRQNQVIKASPLCLRVVNQIGKSVSFVGIIIL